MDDADRSKRDELGGRKAIKVHVAGIIRGGKQLCIRCGLNIGMLLNARERSFETGDNIRIVHQNGFVSQVWIGPDALEANEVKCDLFERI